MDKDRQGNLLLAIALSLLVLIGWGWIERRYFRPPPPASEEATAPVPAAAPGPARVADAPAPAAAPAPNLAAAEAVAAETVVAGPPAQPVVMAAVQTQVLRVEFSSRGAVPRSLTLPLFHSKTGNNGPVEFIVSGEQDDAADRVRREESRALDVVLPNGRRLQDADFALTEWRPGDAAHAALLDALGAALAQPARGSDPQDLREAVAAQLRAVGIAPAVGWAAAAAVTDVPLSKEGQLEQGWSETARANLARLADAQMLDYRLPLETGAVLHKVYLIESDRYGMDLSLVLTSGAEAPARLGDDTGYTLVWGPDLPTSERDARQDPLEAAWVFKSSLKRDKPGVKFLARVGSWLGSGPAPVPQPVEPPPGTAWFSLRRKYFMAAVRPMISGVIGRFAPLADGGVEMQLRAPALVAAAGGMAAHRYVVATTPIHRTELAVLGHEFELAVSFGMFHQFGKVMLSGLLFFNGLVRNYGLAIILLTVLVRVGLFPLNQRAYQSMRAMGVMQPKITELRERYKNDPQEMNKRTWELYRKHNINPLGGCLPIAFQMPVFFALFNALRGAIELRGAHFLWIQDLSEPDRFAMLPGGFAVNILPLLMIGAMLVQQKMSTPPANPTNDPNVEMQRKMMQWMPLMFGVMFYGMPSGLTLYWLVSTLLGIGQQYYVNRPPSVPEPTTPSAR